MAVPAISLGAREIKNRFNLDNIHVDLHVMASGPSADAVENSLHVGGCFIWSIGLKNCRQNVSKNAPDDFQVCGLDVIDVGGIGEHRQVEKHRGALRTLGLKKTEVAKRLVAKDNCFLVGNLRSDPAEEAVRGAVVSEVVEQNSFANRVVGSKKNQKRLSLSACASAMHRILFAQPTLDITTKVLHLG